MEKGNLYLILAVLLFSLQPIFIKLAAGGLPGLLMFTLRFFGALFVFVPLAFHFKKEVRAGIRQWKKFLLPAVFMVGAVSLFSLGIYYTDNATLNGLLSRSNVVFIAVFSVIFFSEERKVFLSKRYLLGLILAGFGVYGIVTGGEALSITVGIGVALVLLSQLSWALYSVLIKRLIRRQTRLTILCFIFPLAFLMSLPFATYDFAFNPGQLIPFFILYPVVGGMALGAANVFQFKAIEEKGLLVTNSFGLVYPFIVAALGFLVFGETLTAIQLAFAGILVAGAYLIIRCKCDVRQID